MPKNSSFTVINVDRSKAEFTIQVDEPAGILAIGIGRDCRFKQNGAPTGEQILKQDARVKAKYFSTIFTGKIAVEVELNPVPEVKHRRFLSSIEQPGAQCVNAEASLHRRGGFGFTRMLPAL